MNRGRTRRAVLTLCLATLMLAVTAGCVVVRASGDTVTETRDVSGFDQVELKGFGELRIEQGNRESLAIEADRNLMRYIETDVRNGVLVISIERSGIPVIMLPEGDVVFRLSVRDLSEVVVSGSGKVLADGLDVGDLRLGLSGSGEVALEDITADTISYEVSGSGRGDATGKADALELQISGSGAFDAGDLEVRQARLEISGSGEATVWATDDLEVDISGSGRVRYYDSPRVDQNVSGSGRVESLGDK